MFIKLSLVLLMVLGLSNSEPCGFTCLNTNSKGECVEFTVEERFDHRPPLYPTRLQMHAIARMEKGQYSGRKTLCPGPSIAAKPGVVTTVPTTTSTTTTPSSTTINATTNDEDYEDYYAAMTDPTIDADYNDQTKDEETVDGEIREEQYEEYIFTTPEPTTKSSFSWFGY